MTTTVTIRRQGHYFNIEGRTAQSAIKRVLGVNVRPVALADLTPEQRDHILMWWSKTDQDLHGELPWGAAINKLCGGTEERDIRGIVAAVNSDGRWCGSA